jgi:hypothetical protein
MVSSSALGNQLDIISRTPTGIPATVAAGQDGRDALGLW